MGNKIKKLLCALLASAMLVTSVGAVSFAAEGDEADTEAVTTFDSGDTADLTDDEKEAEDTEVNVDAANAAQATEAPAATEAPEATETPEATEAPAATETPAATEAPVATAAPVTTTSGVNYDNDEYYVKSLALCSSLGIISGFEDGSVRPDSKVTRAQMASIVLRMLALSGGSTYRNVFTDVTSAHWAADQIQSAYDAKIVSGMGDGTFAPDAEVTYAQVIVMLVNALNFTDDAEYYGGWQQGYIKEAGELELLKSAQSNADEAADRGLVIKMVYNALLADYNEVRSYDEHGYPEYSSDKSLAEVKFDVIEKKGILWGTNKTSLIDTDVQEGQVAITPEKEDDAEVYDTELTGLEEYLAQKVTYYYKENSGRTSEVLAVTYDASKSETYEIKDVEDIESVTQTGGALGPVSIKVEKVTKVKKAADDAKYVYNGRLVDENDLEAGQTMKDLIEDIEQGSIKMVKSDKNNDDYDVVFIDSYLTMIVTSATDKKLIGKIQSTADDAEVGTTVGLTIDVDDSSKDRTVTVTKDDSEIRLRNVKKNDVASVKASLPITDPDVLDVIVTTESITGTVSAMSKGWDESYASINGDRYDVANVAVGDLKSGAQGTFYLDIFGRIARIDSSSAGRTESGEKYGWVMTQFKPDGSSDQTLKIMTQDGVVEAAYATNVDYWEPNALVGSANAGVSKTKAQMETIMANLLDSDTTNGSFLRLWKADTDSSNWVYLSASTGKRMKAREGDSYNTNVRPTDWLHNGSEIRLVKFKLNGSGKITKLYCAVNSTNYSDYKDRYYTNSQWLKSAEDGNYITDPFLEEKDISALKDSGALLFDSRNKSGSVLVGGLLGGYSLTDDCLEFDVPTDEAKYANETSYTVANVVSSRYNVRENGVDDEFYFADYDGTVPAVLVKYVSDPDAAVVASDLGTADNISMMVVDKVNTAVNDDEETIYKVVGYTAGAEVSFTTRTTSTLADVTGMANKKYSATDVWTGKDGGTDADSGDKGVSLANYLKKGDIVVTDGGSKILRLVKGSTVYANKGIDTGSWTAGSDTRVKYYFGPVTSAEVDDVSYIVVNGQSFAMDDGAEMDVVEVDLTRPASAVEVSDDLTTISDIRVMGVDADETDFAFVRIAPKGALGEVIIYRVSGLTANK